MAHRRDCDDLGKGTAVTGRCAEPSALPTETLQRSEHARRGPWADSGLRKPVDSRSVITPHGNPAGRHGAPDDSGSHTRSRRPGHQAPCRSQPAADPSPDQRARPCSRMRGRCFGLGGAHRPRAELGRTRPSRARQRDGDSRREAETGSEAARAARTLRVSGCGRTRIHQPRRMCRGLIEINVRALRPKHVIGDRSLRSNIVATAARAARFRRPGILRQSGPPR